MLLLYFIFPVSHDVQKCPQSGITSARKIDPKIVLKRSNEKGFKQHKNVVDDENDNNHSLLVG